MMRNLLRRYWTPALLSDELPNPDCTPVRLRLLSEDLVAFRDTEGRVGLVDVNCPHGVDNDYLIDRELQRNGTIYTGILGSFGNQDTMARQTAFTDRTKEHLGTLDRKITLMRRLLINAAKNLDRGIEPPALDSSLPYDRIRVPDKVLLPGEDWTTLGTEQDPNYQRLFATASPLAVPPIAAT